MFKIKDCMTFLVCPNHKLHVRYVVFRETMYDDPTPQLVRRLMLLYPDVERHVVFTECKECRRKKCSKESPALAVEVG